MFQINKIAIVMGTGFVLSLLFYSILIDKKSSYSLLRNWSEECRQFAAGPDEYASFSSGVPISKINTYKASISCTKAYGKTRSKKAAFRLARVKFKEKSYASAFKLALISAKKKEYPPAQAMVGMMYLNGQGVKKNPEKALRWFQLAADANIVSAKGVIGNFYYIGKLVRKDEKRGLLLIQQSAIANYQYAQYILAEIYKNTDPSKTLYWHTKAGELGYVWSQERLGWMYLSGNDIDRDYKKASKWFQMAADQGKATAQFELGRLYEIGLGVDKNYSKAMNLYKEAAGRGLAIAQFNIGSMYASGKGVSSNKDEAIKWYNLAGRQNLGIALDRLYLIYATGDGVRKNPLVARQYLKRALQSGYDKSNISAGYISFNAYMKVRINREQSYVFREAKKYFQKALLSKDTEVVKLATLALEELRKSLLPTSKIARIEYRKKNRVSGAKAFVGAVTGLVGLLRKVCNGKCNANAGSGSRYKSGYKGPDTSFISKNPGVDMMIMDMTLN